MSFVPGIISRGYRGYRYLKRVDQKLHYTDPTNKFIQKYVPPGYRAQAFRFNKYAKIATSGGLIYDVIAEITGASLSSIPSPDKFQKERSGYKWNNRSGYRYRPRQYNPRCRPSRSRNRRRSYYR